jgi:hypothetical protein
MIFDFRFDWKEPYRWRTNLRILLPTPFGRLLEKGADCESRGAEHDWYNHNDETSHCYHCQIERAGQLWRKSPADPAPGRGIDQDG